MRPDAESSGTGAGGGVNPVGDFLAGPHRKELIDIGEARPVVVCEQLRVVPATRYQYGVPIAFARHLPRPAPFDDRGDHLADGGGVNHGEAM